MKRTFFAAGVFGAVVAIAPVSHYAIAGGNGLEIEPVVRQASNRPIAGIVKFGDNVSLDEVSNEATNAIVRALKSASGLCGKINPEYRVDCMSDRLAGVAASLPKTGEYAEAKKALEVAAAKLQALAKKNASPSLSKVRVRTGGANSAGRTRPLTPVKTESLDSVNKQARAIIVEAETVLLRSAANSQKRKVHYQKIAKAVGSNKVILRSL